MPESTVLVSFAVAAPWRSRTARRWRSIVPVVSSRTRKRPSDGDNLAVKTVSVVAAGAGGVGALLDLRPPRFGERVDPCLGSNEGAGVGAVAVSQCPREGSRSGALRLPVALDLSDLAVVVTEPGHCSEPGRRGVHAHRAASAEIEPRAPHAHNLPIGNNERQSQTMASVSAS